MGVNIRPSLDQDVKALEQLCRDLFNENINALHLLETGLLGLTAVDEASREVVGFLCLSDKPTFRVGHRPTQAQEDWLELALEARITSSADAYIHVYAVVPQFEAEISLALVCAAVTFVPLLQRLMLAVPIDVGKVPERGLRSLLTAQRKAPGALAQLFTAQRENLLVPLAVRPARVEDHDDMAAVLAREEQRFPALAKLPASSRPQEPFALTRLVSQQDASNVVLLARDVSEVGGEGGSERRGRLAGFMVLTTDVDITTLADAFNLHPYDNFLDQAMYDAQAQQAADTLRKRKRNTLKAKLGTRVVSTPPLDDGASPHEPVNEGSSGEVAAQGSGDAASPDAAPSDNEEPIDITAACEPTLEEVQAEIALMFDPAEHKPSVVAITMACIDEAYEAHTLGFLAHAFEAFPTKKYCLLTLPHNSPEPPLVSCFTRLAPLPGAVFPEVLYLFHRDGLTPGFNVRLGVPQDSDGVSTLIAGMPNAAEIKDLFAAALERHTAVVAVVKREVVGLVTISDTVDVSLLLSHFDLPAVMHLASHPQPAHGEIDMACINPIFAHHARSLLAGAQRLLRKSVLHYALPAAQPPPEVLDVMAQVPPRPSKAGATGGGLEFSLYTFTRRTAFVPRTAVNARLVVVGASEAGMSAVERLLLDPVLLFTHITLLAPCGISVAGIANYYTVEVLAKLGIDAKVAVLDAEMVSLDSQARVVELNDGTQLPYDVLLVTTGLREPTADMVAVHDAESATQVVTGYELAAGLTTADSSIMHKVMIYGHSLEAYHALAALESKTALSKAAFYSAPDQLPPVVAVMYECASALGLELIQPQIATMVHAALRPGSVLFGVNVLAPGTDTAEEVVVDVLVGAQAPVIPKAVFTCLNNEGIVFDGRLVVDDTFATSDPQIYAAGTLCKLSRRYGKDVWLEHYSSREVGRLLAESVIAKLARRPAPDALPALGHAPARVLGCALPGGYTYLFSGCPQALLAPSTQAPPGGRTLNTVSQDGVMHVMLDVQGRIHAIAYLGNAAVQPYLLSSLVGMHHAFLPGLVDRFDSGEVTCLIAYLASQPCVELLQHEQFSILRQHMLAMGVAGLRSGQSAAQVLSSCQDTLIGFVRSRGRQVASLESAAAVAVH